MIDSRDSSVGIATGWNAGVRFPAEAKDFLFITVSRTALGPTQHPTQWLPEILSLGVKWPGRENGHSTISNVEVKKSGVVVSPPLRLSGVVVN
jgi:hypothetical protein